MKNFQFNEAEHVYTLDGKRLYGITSVLGVIAKPSLIQWSANEAIKYVKENALHPEPGVYEVSDEILEVAKTAHRKKKEDAGDFGTNVHKAVECFIKKAPLPELNEQEQKSFDKFVEWAMENKVEFIESEKQMYSETHWTAGTVDFTCIIDGKKYVGDLKTSSGIYGRDYFLQTGGYMIMLEEMGEKDFYGSVIVRCGKKGDFEVKYSYDTEGDKQGFIHALGLFKSLEAWKVK